MVPSLENSTPETGSECAGNVLRHVPVSPSVPTNSTASKPERTLLHVPHPDRLVH